MNKAQNILAIDTAQGGYGLGLSIQGRLKSCIDRDTKSQADILIPAIQGFLKNQNLSFEKLNAIVVTTGPGLFTGLRIGLTAARSLGFSLDIPVLGINCFEALKYQYAIENPNDHRKLFIILETRRDDCYLQIDNNSPTCATKDEIDHTIKENKDQIVVIGNAAKRYINGSHLEDRFEYSDQYNHIDLTSLIRLAQDKGFESARKPEPLYLAGASVSKSKKEQRKIKSV